MFDRAWFEKEIAGLEAQQAALIVQLHQTDGAISVLRQMVQALDRTDGIPLDAFIASALPGATVEGIEPIEGTTDES